MTREGEPVKRKPVNPHADIVGTWTREEPDEAPYPDELTFEVDGIYSGKKAPGSLVASKLDVGVFERISETSIRMSTATDRDETFALDAAPDLLKLVDEQGKKLSYRRSTVSGPAGSERIADVATPAAGEKPTSTPPGDEWVP
jgi:hypothetical protein